MLILGTVIADLLVQVHGRLVRGHTSDVHGDGEARALAQSDGEVGVQVPLYGSR
jgi:hypothetical protein